VLDNRFHRDLLHGRWPDAAAFECDNDLDLEELAGSLLERFRRNRDVEAFALLMRVSRGRLLAIARSVARRLAWDASPQDLVEGALGRLFTEPACACVPAASFLVVARGLLEQQARRRGSWHP
jgi:hypothetical protein